MSNTKKNKKQKQAEHQVLKADKRDYDVLNYLHANAPQRVGDLEGMEVGCFYADDAIDCLLDSPWATGKDAIFTDRRSVVRFGHDLLLKEKFHRAVLIKRRPKLVKPADGNDTPADSGTESKKSKKKVKKKEEEVKETKSEEGKGDDSKKSKKVKKLKLRMPDGQHFDDGREIYVWLYEPVSWRKFLIGFTILVAAIGLCCYPLWPEWMRVIVYYISLSGAGFLGGILFLALVRYIVWATIYLITWRKHSFFLFPNLTEDCGFFESFVPIYSYTRHSDEESSKKSKKDDDSPEMDDISKSEAIEKDDSNRDPGAEGDGTTEKGVDELTADGDGSDNSQVSDFELIQESDLSD